MMQKMVKPLYVPASIKPVKQPDTIYLEIAQEYRDTKVQIKKHMKPYFPGI